MPITQAVNKVKSSTLPRTLARWILMIISWMRDWWLVLFLTDYDLGRFDLFGVGGLVENCSGADPIQLHHFASGQVGCLKLIETVCPRHALIHAEVEKRAAGQQGCRPRIISALLVSDQ